MSVQPYGTEMGPIDPTTGFQDNRYSNVQIPDESKSVPTYASGESVDPNVYKKGKKPVWVDSSKFMTREYNMNGPVWNVFDQVTSEANLGAIRAMEYSKDFRNGPMGRFGKLLNQYGATNSPGVLWSLAQSGLDANAPAVQGLLSTDATATANAYGSSAPSPAASLANNTNDGAWDNFWELPQFLARNAFSAMSAPSEAIQGAVRTAGGEITDDQKPWWDLQSGRVSGAVAAVGSLLPPISFWADRVRGDNDFVNPWEQTEFGQTLLDASGGAGWNAFNINQGGLDVNAALEIVRTLPENADLPDSPETYLQLQSQALQYAKDNNMYSEAGWFIDETSVVGEAQRRATYNSWAIPGPDSQMTAWTFGRGIASNTVGPDSASYGFMSGYIDLQMAVATDPTVIGSKFNIASKTLRGIGRVLENIGVEGAEQALLVGGEAKKVNNLIAGVNRERAAFMEEAAKSGYQLTPEDVQFSELIDNGPDLVRGLLKQQETTNALALVNTGAKDLNAALLAQRRLAGSRGRLLAARGDAEGVSENADNLTSMRTVLNDYMLNTFVTDAKNGPVRSAEKLANWMSSLTPEKAALWEATRADMKMFYDSLTPAQQAAGQFSGRYIKNLDVRLKESAKAGDVVPKPSVADDVIAKDSDLIMNSLEYPAYRQTLSPVKASGTAMIDMPTPGVGVYSVNDGIESVSYLRQGATELKTVDAEEVINRKLAKKISNALVKALKQPGMNPVMPDGEDMGVLGREIFDTVQRTVGNDTERLVVGLADPAANFRGLFGLASEMGLDGFLDNVLRKNGIDGIRGVNFAEKAGVWVGDHPMVETYRLGTDTPVRLNVNSLSVRQLEAKAQQIQKALDDGSRGLTSSIADNIFGAQIAERGLDDAIAKIDVDFADPEKAFRTMFASMAGLKKDGLRGLSMDYPTVRRFMFGRGIMSWMGTKALSNMAEIVPEAQRAKAIEAGVGSEEYMRIIEPYMSELFNLTKMKWTPKIYQAVIENSIRGGGRDGLLEIIAPQMGLDGVQRGSVAMSAARATERDGARNFRSYRRISPFIARALMEMPSGRRVNLLNATDGASAAVLYGRYAKVPEEKIARTVGRILLSDGQPDQGVVTRNAFTSLFDNISEVLVKKIEDSYVLREGKKGGEVSKSKKDAIATQMRQSTRLYLGGKTGDNLRTSMNSKIASGDQFLIDSITGERVADPSILLETELANGFINLPPVDDWEKALNGLYRASAKFKTVDATRELAMGVFDRYFRTAMLAFRASYILRNSSEMQVRMFLNGHQSVFSDPMTLIGMTVGSGIASKARAKSIQRITKELTVIDPVTAQKTVPSYRDVLTRYNEQGNGVFWGGIFDRYSDTILGSKWDVADIEGLRAVGIDVDEAVVTDKIQDFFALMKQSRSLTDPRVFNTARLDGWQPIKFTEDYGVFHDGWAHELIMLNRSRIARVAAGDIPTDWAGTAGVSIIDDQERAVAWLLSDSDEAVDLRKVMESADDAFKAIFTSSDLTKQYLFTSNNSVFNRIMDYTNGDPALIEFIRRGYLRKDGVSPYTINTNPNLRQRIDNLASSLRQITDQDKNMWSEHFNGARDVRVAWREQGKGEKNNIGKEYIDWFFSVANNIERVGSLGPEFKFAYWDKIAELAPSINLEDVPRALKNARTTLPRLQTFADGKLINVGAKHPAFAALKKASEENTGGLLSIDDIHEIANKHAAEHVKELFYDAAKRNNGWNSMRLIYPFGQAWGNTLKTWGELGAKKPIQVYKIQKAVNASQEEGSSTIYETLEDTPVFPSFGAGFAPWEQDAAGGFFYQNNYGDTSFLMPLAGRALSAPLNAWSYFNNDGATMPELPVESPAASLNLAIGSDNPGPGLNPFVGGTLGLGPLKDSAIVSSLRALANPFGEKDASQSFLPAWASKTLAGAASSVPVVGEALESLVGAFSQQHKSKFERDAIAILASTGNYANANNDPLVAKKLQDDAASLSGTILLLTGLSQNVLPSTPLPLPAVLGPKQENESPQLYTIRIVNNLFGQYYERNGFDHTAAVDEMIREMGPSFAFALTGNTKGMSGIPSSQALDWVQSSTENSKIAKANMDFYWFFPVGDSSDVEARLWIADNSRETIMYKNSEEIFNATMETLKRVQMKRVDAQVMGKTMTVDEADALKEEIAKRYENTSAQTTISTDTPEDQLLRANYMVNSYPSIAATPAGMAFKKVWSWREQALAAAREVTGDSNSGLGGKKVRPILDKYLEDVATLMENIPNDQFTILGNKFMGEWD